MGVRVADDFTRPDVALAAAPSSSGFPWLAMRGNPVVSANRGVAGSSSPGNFAVMDNLFLGQDVTLNMHQTANGWGQSFYFRVKDATNWWRWGSYRYSVTTCTAQYDAYGNYIGDSCSTSTYYEMRLQRMTNGSLSSSFSTTSVSSATKSWCLVVRGNRYLGYTSTVAGPITPATGSLVLDYSAPTNDVHRFETKHGFGFYEGSASTYTGLAAYAAVPDYLGGYTPPLYL